MAIIDELATIISFNVPSSAKSALAGVDKSVNKITSGLKSLGIVSAVTSGLFAAFTVNAAKDATALENLSNIVGLQTQEIEALGAVYEKMGGSAKDFEADARKFAENGWGSLDLDRLVSISSEFAGLNDQAANALGRMYGFSESMVRVLQKGPDEVRRMGDEALRYNTTSEDSISLLKELDRAWSGFKNVITPVARDVQAAFAPVLESGLTWLTETLEENRESIRVTLKEIGEIFKAAMDFLSDSAKWAWGALKPMWDELKNSQFIKDMAHNFELLGEKIGGWLDKLDRSAVGDVFSSMAESLKSIANSPALEAIGKIAWLEITAVIEAAIALLEPAAKYMEGTLKLIDGLVNFDGKKIGEGFSRIGTAIGEAFEKAFLDIIPDLAERLYAILKELFSRLPGIGSYFRDPTQEEVQAQKDKEVYDKIYEEELAKEANKGFLTRWTGASFQNRDDAKLAADKRFNEEYVLPRFNTQNNGGGNGRGVTSGQGYQGSSVTIINQYPINPQTPNAAIADQTGGQAYSGASNR